MVKERSVRKRKYLSTSKWSTFPVSLEEVVLFSATAVRVGRWLRFQVAFTGTEEN